MVLLVRLTHHNTKNNAHTLKSIIIILMLTITFFFLNKRFSIVRTIYVYSNVHPIVRSYCLSHIGASCCHSKLGAIANSLNRKSHCTDSTNDNNFYHTHSHASRHHLIKSFHIMKSNLFLLPNRIGT